MASKQKLSDLLREEVNKIPHSSLSLSEHPLTTKKESMNPSTSESAKDNKKATTVTTSQTTTRKSSSRLTKVQLENKVNSLTEDLRAAQDKESSLQEQVNHLAFTLEQKNSSIEDLQDSLVQTQSLKTELEQVKTDALKLAQENHRLQTDLASLKQDNLELTAQLHKPSTSLIVPSRSILERPILPTKLPNQTGQASNNFDIWCYD